jgi:phosphatidylglycerol---prolipoprotein diacylglyceryl transferase
VLQATLAYPSIDPVAFEIGPLVIRWYALAYLAGLILGWRYCIHLARRLPGRPDPIDFDDFLTWAVIGVVLGGRIGYVLFYNLPQYLAHPLEALEVWKGGMSFHGGLTGVVVAVLLFCRHRGISPYAFADIVGAAAPIGLFFGRLANFVNGELYGRAADASVSWAMIFPHDPLQIPRHPSQLYEAGLEGLVLFVLMAVLVHNRRIAERPGLAGGVFFLGYSAARIVSEFFREPDAQLGFPWGGATMGQILCLPMILFGAWLAIRARRTVPA